MSEESLVRLRDKPYSDSDLKLDIYGGRDERVTETLFESRLSEFWVWGYKFFHAYRCKHKENRSGEWISRRERW